MLVFMLLNYDHPSFHIGLLVFKFVAHLLFTLVSVFSSCNKLPLCVGFFIGMVISHPPRCNHLVVSLVANHLPI
jgi:hypothetical protein